MVVCTTAALFVNGSEGKNECSWRHRVWRLDGRGHEGGNEGGEGTVTAGKGDGEDAFE